MIGRDDSEERKPLRQNMVSERVPLILKATVTQYLPAATTRGKALVRGGDELRIVLQPQTRPGKSPSSVSFTCNAPSYLDWAKPYIDAVEVQPT